MPPPRLWVFSRQTSRVRTEFVENARGFLSTWDDYQLAMNDQRDREFHKAQVKQRGIDEAEVVRKELVELWPEGVPIPDEYDWKALTSVHDWSPRPDGSLRVTLDVRTLLALVKAARREALDEYDGSGGRLARVVDHR